MDIDDILKAILDGAADEHESQVYAALKLRTDQLAARKAFGLTDQDTVIFNSKANPKYLKGNTGKVKKVNKTTALVQVPAEGWKGDAGGRWRPGASIKVPLIMIDKVPA